METGEEQVYALHGGDTLYLEHHVQVLWKTVVKKVSDYVSPLDQNSNLSQICV